MLKLKPVASPDVRVIPWASIIILVVLAAIFWAVRVRWVRFRARRLDPVFDEVGDSFDEGRSKVSGWFSRDRKGKGGTTPGVTPGKAPDDGTGGA